MQHRPIAIGLVVCEQAIVDETSRNVTPVNCFTSRKAKTVPAQIPFTVVAWLTNGMGDAKVEVTVERLDNLDEIDRTSRAFRFGNPLQEVRCIVRHSECIFPVFGSYQISLSVGGEVVAHRKILIYEKEQKT